MYTSSSRLNDLEFLTRSSNRLDVLDAILDTPRSRRELRDDTAFSRVTLSRILNDLTERGWVAPRNGHYEITPEGAIVGAEVRRLVTNLDAVDTLGETLAWLPTDQFDFELGRLANAEVLVPDGYDLTGQIRWVAHRVRNGGYIRSVGTWVAAEILESFVELTTTGNCRFEGVVEASVVDHVRADAELQPLVEALLESDQVCLYKYEGAEAKTTMSVFPDGVLLCGRRDAQSFPQAVGSTDDTVVAWATAHFESLRDESILLTSDAFTA